MAATGPPVAKFSNLFGQADLWDSPDVDMAPIHTILGSASTEGQTTARAAFLNFATRSPTVFAITLAGNTDRIYIAHAPTVYPARAGAATNHDNLVVALINDDADALLNITLPADAFSRSGEVRCVRKAALCKTGYHRQVEKYPRTKSKTNLRSETEKHNTQKWHPP